MQLFMVLSMVFWPARLNKGFKPRYYHNVNFQNPLSSLYDSDLLNYRVLYCYLKLNELHGIEPTKSYVRELRPFSLITFWA